MRRAFALLLLVGSATAEPVPRPLTEEPVPTRPSPAPAQPLPTMRTVCVDRDAGRCWSVAGDDPCAGYVVFRIVLAPDAATGVTDCERTLVR